MFFFKASQGVSVEKDRYVADLFYMAPLYPRAFVNLKELLVIDRIVRKYVILTPIKEQEV